MIDILDKLRAEYELCEIYSGEDAESCEAGYVIAVSDKCYLMECVTPAGEHGGFIYGQIDDVVKAQSKTRYLSELRKLMTKVQFMPKPSPVESDDILEELLCYLQSAGRICYYSLICGDYAGYGIVKDYTGTTVTFNSVDGYGNPDGECAVRREDLMNLAFGGSEEVKLEKLSDRR